MPTVHIHGADGERHVPLSPGGSLRDILSEAGIPLRSGCGGSGACGLCLVQIDAGAVHEPTAVERGRLTEQQLADGLRLACQVRPREDIGVSILSPSPSSSWRPIEGHEYAPCAENFLPRHSSHPRAAGEKSLGVAVDLGTTHIRTTLWHKRSATRLTGRCGINPQVTAGSDVMSRLAAACQSEGHALRIAMLARNALGEAMRVMALSEGLSPSDIDEVVIVGNTAMLALFSAQNYQLLLKPEHWDRRIDCTPEASHLYAETWGIASDARVSLMPPLGGFVGSDLMAGVLATGLMRNNLVSLLIDFGTNSEVALWDGNILWATSAAGGPAFEGVGIPCGMPAEAGAIFRVRSLGFEDSADFDVIGGGAGCGLCGSGIIDLLALLIENGIITSVGNFGKHRGNVGVMLSQQPVKITLSKADIDLFQRAKAAIAAGIQCLMEASGVREKEVDRVYVAGAFGAFLDVKNAQKIGLLPEIAMEKVFPFGNTALAGCEQALFLSDRPGPWHTLQETSKVLNLAQVPLFEGHFVENLRLRPMRLP